MNTKVKVSVCIPTYNQPEFFEYTLKSVLQQEYEDYEIIITDDSTNNVIWNVLQKFLPNINIHYFKNKEPKGAPKNWNEAISKASGEYIKILHHDDWFTQKNSLATFVKTMDNNPEVNFCFSSTEVNDSNRDIVRINTLNKKQLDILKKDSTILFFGNIIGAPSVTMYRSSVLEKYDTNLKWLVDLELYIRILKKNDFIYIDEPLIATTSQADHQVTNSCQGNKVVEIYEYIYLYYKIKQISTLDILNHLKLVLNKNNIMIWDDIKFIEEKIQINDDIKSILKPVFIKRLKQVFKRIFQ